MEARVSERNLLQTWIDGIKRKLVTNNKLNDILSRIKGCHFNQDIIRCFLSEGDVQNALERLRSRMPGHDKSSSESESLRMKANELLHRCDHKGALHAYNLSVCTAPMDETESEHNTVYAMGLASRSAALFHLGFYELCVEDINMAMANGYPENLRYKLLDRKGRGLMKLGKFLEARYSLEDGIKHLKKWSQESEAKIVKCRTDFRNSLEICQDLCNNNSDIEENRNVCPTLKKHTRSLPKLSDMNAGYPTLSSKCEVRENESRGRHIVANQDILPGEVLVSEAPYASILLPKFYDTHCQHCFTKLIVAVPCHLCRSVKFCSSTCKEEGWDSYHKYECLILDMLVSCGVGRIGLLALRTVSITPFPDLVASEDIQLGELGVSEGRKGYNAITPLITHLKDRSAEDLLQRSLEALFIAHIFRNSCYIPKGIECDPKDLREVSSAILHLLQLLPCNAHSISEFSLNPKAVIESVPVEIGSGIYPTLSLLNHSCDPLTTRNNYGSLTISRSIAYIRKGEEITDNYGAVFAVQSREKRIAKLAPQYYFTCNCDACFNDWSQCNDDSCFAPPGWKCENCGSKLPSVQNTNFHEELVQSDEAPEERMKHMNETIQRKVQCKSCHHFNSIIAKMEQLQKSGISYLRALENLKKGDAAEALPVLIDHLTLMEKHTLHPWRDIIMGQEAVKQCFSIQANCESIC